MNQKQRTVRNLVIFVAALVALPWLGWWLDSQRGVDSHQQDGSLGWLLFILTPLLMVLLLRTLGGDGWKDAGLKPRFRGNGGWYLFSVFYHPLSMVVLVGLGVLWGSMSIPEITASTWALFGQGLAVGLLPSVLKNVFEEFAWRGYLTPRVDSLVKNGLVGHLVVGLIWMVWHLPYYLVLLAPDTLGKATNLDLIPFLVMGLVGILPTAIIYGELRLRTNSVWPPLILHVTANLFFDTLIAQQLFAYRNPELEVVFSPGLYGVIVIALNLGVGLWLYWSRTRAQAGSNLAKNSA